MPESLSLLKKNIDAHAATGLQPIIIVVTKQQSVEAILPFLQEGHLDYGENRLQEAESKWPELKRLYPNSILHCIGPLQSNKVKKAVALFDVIATIDRPEIAKMIQDECLKQKRQLRFLIQVNIGREKQKHGVLPEDLGALLSYCREDLKMDIEGLQAIPPKAKDPEPYFAELKQLAAQHHVQKVSMGMSSDYKIAVKMGSDYVRIGSLLFGDRV